jgi:hypothetical protein
MHPTQCRNAASAVALPAPRPHLQGQGEPDTEEGLSPMSTLMTRIQDSLRKRAAYARTVAEIEAMPLEVAIDLDIYKPDAAKIAAKAVYGR